MTMHITELEVRKTRGNLQISLEDFQNSLADLQTMFSKFARQSMEIPAKLGTQNQEHLTFVYPKLISPLYCF